MRYLKETDLQTGEIKMKKVMVWTGAGQIGMAIARRMGYGMKIVVGDKKIENAKAIADIMNGAGYDVTPVETDLSERDSILELIDIGKKARRYNYACKCCGRISEPGTC